MSVVRIEREGSVAVVVIDNPPVNASSQAVREGLLRAVREIDGDSSVTAAVLVGVGRAFMGGADIREFDKPPADPQLPEVIEAIMDSPKPWAAAIHGAALGGGLELAFACDVRVAQEGSQLGLPEVTLGMMPGAGGTQHLPRIVGIVRAIEIICSGRRMDAEEACALGIVDAVVAGDVRAAAVGAMPRGKNPVRDRPVPASDEESVAQAGRAAVAANPGRQITAAIDSIKRSGTTLYGEAMARERAAFLALRASPEAVELRRKFFAARAAAKNASDKA
ncbi:MAG: enoyl-CoA hydratase/isomerase family protein [Burkholderiales bacterium]|nr:enoyl-CoA hydratase/isomerase family protein [Burkholderiales bacterium]